MKVKSLTFAYDETEDRILLGCSNDSQSRRLLLTRRITRRLLSAFANVLKTSSRAVKQAPADLRREVIVLEHLASLSAEQPAAGGTVGAGDPAALADLGQALVWKVDVAVEPVLFTLSFHSTTAPLAALSLNRADFHKVLAALDHCALVAEWDVHAEAGWLGEAENVAASMERRNAS